jgi:hypothetical protein
MAADVCECGHLDVPTHADGTGACRAFGCECEQFVPEDESTIEEAA